MKSGGMIEKNLDVCQHIHHEQAKQEIGVILAINENIC